MTEKQARIKARQIWGKNGDVMFANAKNTKTGDKEKIYWVGYREKVSKLGVLFNVMIAKGESSIGYEDAFENAGVLK